MSVTVASVATPAVGGTVTVAASEDEAETDAAAALVGGGERVGLSIGVAE